MDKTVFLSSSIRRANSIKIKRKDGSIQLNTLHLYIKKMNPFRSLGFIFKTIIRLYWFKQVVRDLLAHVQIRLY